MIVGGRFTIVISVSTGWTCTEPTGWTVGIRTVGFIALLTAARTVGIRTVGDSKTGATN